MQGWEPLQDHQPSNKQPGGAQDHGLLVCAWQKEYSTTQTFVVANTTKVIWLRCSSHWHAPLRYYFPTASRRSTILR